MSIKVKITLIFAVLSFPGLLWLIIYNSRKPANSEQEQLIIFHAGSLAVPFKQISEEFTSRHPEVNIIIEAAGSRICARKITDLNKACDIIASADYTVIDELLIPEYADWNIKFATNEMVIAYDENSYRSNQIDKDNWYDILLDRKVSFGRSDPNSDPCGYRALFTMMLAEKFYNKPDIVNSMKAKDRQYIRPKEVDLLALLETGTIDYIFIYRSVAVQHNLKYLELPDKINLKMADLSDFYKTASVRLTGKKPGTFITKVGEPIIYSVTIPKNAPNRRLALAFLSFLLDADSGGSILERNGQSPVVPSSTDTFDKLPESLKIFCASGKYKMKSEIKTRKYEPLSLLFTAFGGVLLLFIIAPLISMFIDCSLPELTQTARDPEVRNSIWLTLWTSMAATILFAIAAIPFSYLLARKDFPFKGLVTGIIDLPIVIPHLAAGLALLGVLSKNGLFGKGADKLGFDFVGSSPGIILAMAFVSIPFLLNSARDGFLAVPVRLEKAALNLGASPLRVFLTISVPLASRSIVSGLILMWARGMSEFGAVLIIAYHPMTTPILIYERFGAYGLKYARPVAVLFVLICLVFFVILRLLVRGKNAALR